MIIYNVTSNIQENIHDQWLTWMQEKHIPAVLATGIFSSARIVRVLIKEEMGGLTYAVQYTTDSKEKLNHYYLEHALRFQEDVKQLFGDTVLSFRTELEHVSEHYSLASAQ